MRTHLLSLVASCLFIPLLGAACSSASEPSSDTAGALGAIKLPPPPHPGAHPMPVVYPALNEVFQKNVHNAYWTQNIGSPGDGKDLGAAGVHMRTWDMMLHEHVRSLEWDLHRDVDDPYTGRGKHPGEFRIYHTSEPDNSTCFSLADCLQLLQRLDVVLPQHEVVHVALELKQVDRLAFDDGVFDDSDFKPEEIDRVLWEHLGSKIYTPAEFLSRCDPGMNMRQCAAAKGWPTIDELRGRYLFTVHGTETPYTPGACNERAWWQYAGVDIHTRAAFPMYVVSDTVPDAQRPRERMIRYNTPTQDFEKMWRTALDNTVIFDLEATNNTQFNPTDGSVPFPSTFNAIVRGAAAHEINPPKPSGPEDDYGTILQADSLLHGWQWIMTDYPVNFVSDAQIDDGNPLKLATRVSRPFFRKIDTTAARVPETAGYPQPPTYGEPELVEPGSRLYFDTANRITKLDLFDAPGAPMQSDPLHTGYAQAIYPAAATVVGGPNGYEDWQLFPATSMQGHDSGPLETTPWGEGCFVAGSAPNAQGNVLRVCRAPQADAGRNVQVRVSVSGPAQPAYAKTVTLPFHIVQTANVGDALRVILVRSPSKTTAQIFTAAEVSPDGTMQWLPWSDATITIGADLRYEGLAQTNDGVFTGTRLNGQPVSLSQLTTGPSDHYVYDLSYCDDGACRGAALPSHETFFTSTADDAQYVAVHETEGTVYDGQWRTLYTTDRFEMSSSGLPQYPRPNKFLLRRTAGSDALWTPLYKCIDWSRDVHTYWLDTDGTCPNDKGPRGRTSGVAGLIASRPLPNTAPLYHVRKGTHNATNVNTHDHYFALGSAELSTKTNSEGYELVKQVGWVYTPDSLNIPVCVPHATCTNGATCGTQDDGCGTGTIVCGQCAAGNVCNINRCVPSSSNAGCRASCEQNREACVDSGDPILIKRCTSMYRACIAACTAPK